jgi:NADH-quinone oxidoreductase subunit C
MNDLMSLDTVARAMNECGPAKMAGPGRIAIMTTSDKIREAIRVARDDLQCDRLITISSADNGTALELVYHLTGPHRTVISISMAVPRDAPQAPSLSDILPPAGIYERQIHDLLGIVFTGHPGLKRIMLNEDWPENEFPLRKDWKPGPDVFYGGLRPEGR